MRCVTVSDGELIAIRKQGKTNRQIADHLDIGLSDVELRFAEINRKRDEMRAGVDAARCEKNAAKTGDKRKKAAPSHRECREQADEDAVPSTAVEEKIVADVAVVERLSGATERERYIEELERVEADLNVEKCRERM